MLHSPAGYEAGEPHPCRAALLVGGRGKWVVCAISRDALPGPFAMRSPAVRRPDDRLDARDGRYAFGDGSLALGRADGSPRARRGDELLGVAAAAAQLALQAGARLADVALELVAGGGAAALD